MVSGLPNNGDVDEFNGSMSFEDGCNFMTGNMQRKMVNEAST